MKKILLSSIAFLALGSTAFSSEIQQTISIYGWLPSLDGNIKYDLPTGGGSSEETELGLGDNIDFAFMGSYELKKDNYLFFFDGMYLKMSGEQSTELNFLQDRVKISVNATQDLETWLLSVYGGYKIFEQDNFNIYGVAGIRALSLRPELTFSLNNFQTGIDKDIDIYDGVVGFKGSYDINENWFIPFFADIGGGDSDLTWQAYGSIGYKFDWGDLLATYRYVHYEQDGFVKNLDLYGPKIGVNFHF